MFRQEYQQVCIETEGGKVILEFPAEQPEQSFDAGSRRLSKDTSQTKKDTSQAKKDTSQTKKDTSQAKKETSQTKKEICQVKKEIREIFACELQEALKRRYE